MVKHDPFVEDFVDYTLKNYQDKTWTMDQMRFYIPRLIMYIWEDRKPKGMNKKGTNMYKKPRDFPEHCPFVDPNNTDSTGKKPKKEIVEKMFVELLKLFIEKRDTNPVVTAFTNPRQGDIAIYTSGNVEGTNYVPVKEYAQSVNVSSQMGPPTVSEDEMARVAPCIAYPNYNHQHDVKNGETVLKFLRNFNRVMGEKISSRQKVELVIDGPQTYTNNDIEHTEMWDCLRDIRDFIDKYELYGMRALEDFLDVYERWSHLFDKPQTTQHMRNPEDDQRPNISDHDEQSVMLDDQSSGIEKITDEQPAPVPDTSPSLSTSLDHQELDFFEELLKVLDIVPNESDASSKMLGSSRPGFYQTTTYPADPGSDVQKPSSADSNSKRKSDNTGSPMPYKVQKLEGCDKGVNSGMISSEPPEQGGGKAALEDLMGKDNSQFRGVQSVIDTSNDLESDDDSETVIQPTQNQHYSEATTSHQNITPLRSETSTTTSVPQARRKIAPKRIIPQVQSNEELTRDVLLLQKEVYTLEKQKLELQLDELWHKRMRDTRPTGCLPPTPIMTAQAAVLPVAVSGLAPGVYE